MECAIQLQLGCEPTSQLIDTVLKISSEYKGDKHTGIEDVLPHVPRYNNNIEITITNQVWCVYFFVFGFVFNFNFRESINIKLTQNNEI